MEIMGLFDPAIYERLLRRAIARESGWVREGIPLGAPTIKIREMDPTPSDTRRFAWYARLARWNSHRVSYRIAFGDPNAMAENKLAEMLAEGRLIGPPLPRH
jgi:hypothetical protein